jgi:hypothetical protein
VTGPDVTLAKHARTYVERVLAEAPPLTEQQEAAIAVLCSRVVRA